MSRDSSARLLVSCGSLLLQTGAVPEAIHADAALIADVAEELSAVRLGSPALAVALARGETTATLLARAHSLHPELRGFREAILALGTVDLHDGLGMLASLGRVAGIIALEQDRVRARIDKDLVIPLMRLRNGSLRHVAIWALNSLAGGVGALAGALFAQAAAASVLDLSHSIIDVLSFQVGALTFLGLGDRILDNAAIGLIEQLALLTDRDRDPRESRQLVLTELPTVDITGNEIAYNRSLRSSLAVSLACAFAAKAVQRRIQASRTNRALGTYLGGVTMLRADWFGSLSAEEVVAEAARNYLGQLDVPDGAAEVVQSPRLEFLETQQSAHLKAPAELAALALRSRSGKPESFEADALAETKFAVAVRLDGLSPERASAAAVESALAGGHGPAMRRLNAMSAAIETALIAERLAESRESMRADSRKRRLRELIAVLFPDGIMWASAQRFFTGPGKAAANFTKVMSSWREVQIRQSLAAARGSALEGAAVVIRSAIARVKSMLARLRAALEVLVGSHARRMFRYSPMSEVSGAFMQCVASGDIPLLRSHLARSVQEVTPEGLAEMVKANGPEPAEIVARLQSPALFSAPFWGGAEPSGPPFFTAIVLPPVHPTWLASLQDAARSAGLRFEVLAGDSLAAGAAVVGLEVYESRSIIELFPAPYLAGLREIAGPKSSLYPTRLEVQLLIKTVLSGGGACA